MTQRRVRSKKVASTVYCKSKQPDVTGLASRPELLRTHGQHARMRATCTGFFDLQAQIDNNTQNGKNLLRIVR